MSFVLFGAIVLPLRMHNVNEFTPLIENSYKMNICKKDIFPLEPYNLKYFDFLYVMVYVQGINVPL